MAAESSSDEDQQETTDSDANKAHTAQRQLLCLMAENFNKEKC